MTKNISFCCFPRAAKTIKSTVPEPSEPEVPKKSCHKVWKADGQKLHRLIQEIPDLKSERFTTEQLGKMTENYSKLIGCGGYGKVYQGVLPNGVKVAVKLLSEKIDVKKSFLSEVSTIGKMDHSNLLKLYGYCYDPPFKALVYEFMEKGSLDKYLFRKDVEPLLPWPKLMEIVMGVAKGLTYLHAEGHQRLKIVHYDIKPENILLDCNFFPKIADFGLANHCNTDGSLVFHPKLERRGTPGYVAPEFTLMSSPISHKCDVYSFGILLFEIVGRRKNTRVGESGESIDWFPKRVWESFEKGELRMVAGVEREYQPAAEKVAMVALWCVQDSPEDRPEMCEVVKMLESGVEILPPPRPFRYLFSLEENEVPSSSLSDWDSDCRTSNAKSQSD